MRGMIGFVLVLSVLTAGAAHCAPRKLDFTPRTDWGAWTSTTPTLLKINACEVAPTIDGSPDDAAWEAATKVTFPRGTTTYPPTEVAICFSDEQLFIRALCTEQPGRERVAPERKRDDGAYSDDCIEIWFDLKGGGSEIYQFVISSANSIYDARDQARATFKP